MAGVDSLLRMMVNHGADELRIGTDLPPKMLSRGSAVRLSIPATDDAMMQHLLEGILTPEREASLRRDGKLELTYEGYAVALQPRGAGLEATFKKGAAAPARPSPPPPAPAPAPVAAPIAAPPPAPSVSATIGASTLLEQ